MITLAHKGIANQYHIPNLCVVHSVQQYTNKKANPKLTAIVVPVKKRLILACCYLLYCNLTRGIINSNSQKKVSPKASINARCQLCKCSQ